MSSTEDFRSVAASVKNTSLNDLQAEMQRLFQEFNQVDVAMYQTWRTGSKFEEDQVYRGNQTREAFEKARTRVIHKIAQDAMAQFESVIADYNLQPHYPIVHEEINGVFQQYLAHRL